MFNTNHDTIRKWKRHFHANIKWEHFFFFLFGPINFNYWLEWKIHFIWILSYSKSLRMIIQNHYTFSKHLFMISKMSTAVIIGRAGTCKLPFLILEYKLSRPWFSSSWFVNSYFKVESYWTMLQHLSASKSLFEWCDLYLNKKKKYYVQLP